MHPTVVNETPSNAKAALPPASSVFWFALCTTRKRPIVVLWVVTGRCSRKCQLQGFSQTSRPRSGTHAEGVVTIDIHTPSVLRVATGQGKRLHRLATLGSSRVRACGSAGSNVSTKRHGPAQPCAAKGRPSIRVLCLCVPMPQCPSHTQNTEEAVNKGPTHHRERKPPVTAPALF